VTAACTGYRQFVSEVQCRFVEFKIGPLAEELYFGVFACDGSGDTGDADVEVAAPRATSVATMALQSGMDVH